MSVVRAPGGQSPAERWTSLVTARLEELAVLREAIDERYWDRFAQRYARKTAGTAETDPLFTYLREHVDGTSTVLDVGSGPGRFSLALAPLVGRVTAVDQSRTMLELLRSEANERDLDDVETVHSRFEDADGLEADVAVCAYVIPIIADLATFARGLDRAATRRVVVYMNAVSADALTAPFWRYFHGADRAPSPTYLDAVEVIREATGADPAVQIVEAPMTSRFATLEEAVDDHLRLLALPDECRAELRRLLDPWLVADDERGLRPPWKYVTAAIISWCPR